MVHKERTFYGETPQGDEPKNDAALEDKVAACLTGVDGLDASDINVVCEGQTIYLSGTVPTDPEVARAGEAALTVEGVANVENRIGVINAKTP